MMNPLAIIEDDPARHDRDEIEAIKARHKHASIRAAEMRTVERQAKAHAEHFEKIAEINASALSAYGVTLTG